MNTQKVKRGRGPGCGYILNKRDIKLIKLVNYLNLKKGKGNKTLLINKELKKKEEKLN